jgi:hypothetical protein
MAGGMNADALAFKKTATHFTELKKRATFGIWAKLVVALTVLRYQQFSA